MSFEETITVQWSSCLETLADELLKSLEGCVCSPFDKICIVVNDAASENWLKHYFLLERKVPQVLMNLAFVRLPEFLNDWLAAMVHGTDPRQRWAALHPYSPGVLTWRICRILKSAAPDGELAELLHYIGQENVSLRRFDLARKLAKLYDDYQNSRFQMLRNWEKGKLDCAGEVPPWQTALYRMLAAEDPGTYARDFETAFLPETDAAAALRNGFPHYRGIHVFDIPFLPEPMLRLLEKISEAIPLNVWCFNPQSEWLANTPSSRETVREMRKQLEVQRDLKRHRESLQSGTVPEEVKLCDVADFYDSPEERLFGTFASGARAVLWNWCLDTNTEAVGSRESIGELRQITICLHRTYSPRRELEAVRDGLCDFFRRNPDAGPGDAMVLCADWETYAPVIESVFGTGRGEGTVPVTVAGGVSGDTPFTRSLQDLLAFRENRFEVSAVFNLLGLPSIRESFGLDAAAVGVLRDMVRKANIHWGFDEADVRRSLQMTPEQAEAAAKDGAKSPYPFTWRRGYDRLISEMLYGFPGDDDTLLAEVGTLRDLHPCGRMEGERTGYAASLWEFVSRLNELRSRLAPGTEYPAEELASAMSWVLDTFYRADEHTVKEMLSARRAIRGVSDALKVAKIQMVSTDAFLAAVTGAVKGFLPGMRSPGNAVLFAPLNTYTATPRKLIWVCGLNDGAFPKSENRPSYDLIGKHPSPFDATVRERGAFALLKAVLGARKQLALSYVGKDIRTNEEVPPSVLLNDLLDYFGAVRIPVTTCDHPMHAYSRKYFYRPSGTAETASHLPPSSSPRDEAVARLLREGARKATGICAFPLAEGGATEISLEALEAFFSAPNRYLLESRGAKIPESRFDRVEDKEALSGRINRKLQRKLALGEPRTKTTATLMVECGSAPDEPAAFAAIDKALEADAAGRKLTFPSAYAGFNCLAPDGTPETFADAYRAYLENAKGTEENVALDLTVEGHPVHLAMTLAHPVKRKTPDGMQAFQVFFEDAVDDASRNRVWLRHLGANAGLERCATFLFGLKGTGTLFLPLAKEEAETALAQAVKVAATVLPPEFPSWEMMLENDVLPEEFPRRLWLEERLVSTRQSRAKKDQ